MRKIWLVQLLIIVACTKSLGQVSDTLVLYFENARYNLQPEQLGQLKSVAALATAGKISSIRIYGYTDQTGTLPGNQDLSVKRAETVKKHLLDQFNIPPKLIKDCRGMGPKLAPAASENHKENAKHRRVEIITARRQQLPDLTRLRQGENLVLENLDFLPGRHVITPDSKPALENLLALLQQNPTLIIAIQGHICCQAGTDGYDSDTGKNELSANRAKFVYDYLIKNGISPNRLSYRGFGRTRPIVDPEVTEEDRQKNRRVEIQIISK